MLPPLLQPLSIKILKPRACPLPLLAFCPKP